ncbi:MAG: hypothetical protein CNIPEHKO_01339 [Anaerolineales bacterium]|nr:hypothetical protein [Anaerolineales bacterium]
MKNRKSPSRLLLGVGILILTVSILAGITCILLILNNLTLNSQTETTLQNLNKTISDFSPNKPPPILDLSTTVQLSANALENVSTLQKNWIYTFVAGTMATGFAVVGVFYSIWLVITFNTIKRDFNNLQEKYSLLLGSKRIIDSELEAAKRQLSEQDIKFKRR